MDEEEGGDAVIDDDAFYDDDFRLANGLAGETLTIPSANPKNFHQAVSDTDAMPRQDLWGKLFLPEGPVPFPVVIIAPGSLGLQPHHLGIAAAITDAAIAACAIDPFGTRSVVSTVANQVQFSFAASAWDVLAAAGLLAARPDIDPARIGAQGHSRGGSAVLNAASVHLAAAANAPKLVGVYAAYPWSGQQFLDPAVGSTRVRAIIGDRDDWCSPMQVQAHIHAIRLAGGDATVRIVAGAPHSFDRTAPPRAHAPRLGDTGSAHVLHRRRRRLHPADLRRARPGAGRSRRLHVLHRSRLRSPRRQHWRQARPRAALHGGHDHVLDDVMAPTTT